MSDLRARLLEEIKRRIAALRANMTECPAYVVEVQRDAELSAALRVAELHAPTPERRCLECYDGHDDWPCDTAKALLDTFVMDWRK